MALTQTPNNPYFQYMCLSTDIVSNAVPGCTMIGAIVYVKDSKVYKVVDSDGSTLLDFKQPLVA